MRQYRLSKFFAIMLCVCIASQFACADPEENNTNNTKNVTNNADKRIACDAYTWCTSWDANDTAPTMPALNGGVITDGLYRIQEGRLGLTAFLFQGQRVLEVGQNDNQEGAWSVDGNTLTINFTRTCDELNTNNDWDYTVRYDYSVEGANLYLQEQDCTRNCALRFERLTNLCREDQHVSCMVSNCACVVKQNSGFPGSCY